MDTDALMEREDVLYHPRAGNKVWSAIWNSNDTTALHDVALHAAEWSPREILRRLTAQ